MHLWNKKFPSANANEFIESRNMERILSLNFVSIQEMIKLKPRLSELPQVWMEVTR